MTTAQEFEKNYEQIFKTVNGHYTGYIQRVYFQALSNNFVKFNFTIDNKNHYDLWPK